jgi:hypothetical protein
LRSAVDPNGRYLDAPAGDTSNGDAFQAYSHFESGRRYFHELEAHAPAVVLEPGQDQMHTVDLLIYRGNVESL